MAAMHVDQQVADQRLPQVLPARDIFERHTPKLMLARTKVGETVSVRPQTAIEGSSHGQGEGTME